MCNLYSITTNQAAIIALFHASTTMWATCPQCPACFLTTLPRDSQYLHRHRGGHDALGMRPRHCNGRCLMML
jgi:hypothetical protein